MKSIRKHLFTAILLAGFAWTLAGCVGYVGDGPGYYHHGWYHDGPWMGGPRGYVGVRIYPGR